MQIYNLYDRNCADFVREIDVAQARQHRMSPRMPPDLDAASREAPEPLSIEERQLRHPRIAPLVGAAGAVGHGEGDGGNPPRFQNRQRMLQHTAVAVVERQQQWASRQRRAAEVRGNVAGAHKMPAQALQRADLPPELDGRDPVRLELPRTAGLCDRMIGEHPERTRPSAGPGPFAQCRAGHSHAAAQAPAGGAMPRRAAVMPPAAATPRQYSR